MKFLHDDVLAGGLDFIVANCDGCFVCTSDVATTGVPDWTKISDTQRLTSLNSMDSADFTEVFWQCRTLSGVEKDMTVVRLDPKRKAMLGGEARSGLIVDQDGDVSFRCVH